MIEVAELTSAADVLANYTAGYRRRRAIKPVKRPILLETPEIVEERNKRKPMPRNVFRSIVKLQENVTTHELDIDADATPQGRSLKSIVRLVSLYTGISETAIISGRRYTPIVRARQCVYSIAVRHTKLSLIEVGRRLNKDHTTVLYGADKYVYDRQRMGKLLNLELRTNAKKIQQRGEAK